ncbi:hypothetical protein Cni_G08833 [Canna indica]|uniref:LysM domain-containing protein n=1 Tax=Canna indica TaxID=4628 RepID=A0AAQ3Q923_9LILI|nr:hypothetical protein Cni_G08833 [Canna indica]
MAAAPTTRRPLAAAAISIADATAWFLALSLLALILICSLREEDPAAAVPSFAAAGLVRGAKFAERACDEIYVVGEGETLHTISDKCGDPFIVERNPHIHDPDDVFPGLVIKLNPSKPR